MYCRQSRFMLPCRKLTCSLLKNEHRVGVQTSATFINQSTKGFREDMSVDVTQSTWLEAGVHAPSHVTSHRQYRPWNIQPRGDLSPGLSKHIHQCKLVLCVHNLRQIRTKCKTKLRVDQWFTAKIGATLIELYVRSVKPKIQANVFQKKRNCIFIFMPFHCVSGGQNSPA